MYLRGWSLFFSAVVWFTCYLFFPTWWLTTSSIVNLGIAALFVLYFTANLFLLDIWIKRNTVSPLHPNEALPKIPTENKPHKTQSLNTTTTKAPGSNMNLLDNGAGLRIKDVLKNVIN
ncbi:hypothetical protein ACFL5I_00635, partial [Planctomycetota bacterium]